MYRQWKTLCYSLFKNAIFLSLIVATSITEGAAAPSFGQQDTSVVTLRLTNETLERAFREINHQTPYRVLYANVLIDQAKKVTTSLNKVSITTALKELLKDQPFTYTIDGRNIIIIPKKPGSADGPDIPSPSPNTKPEPISGLISDSLGNPLAGASITIQGKRITTVSDVSGRFNIEANTGDVLIISFVGYENQMVTVKNQQPISIRLTRKISGLDEVTVMSTGYQEIPKERATGSFVQIDNELINRSVSDNIMDRIKYVANGLNYEPKIGDVNNRSAINIRGISTINASMSPLVVVDNVPYDGDINLLSPNDVESVTILRDAAAASIWGVRSGNGVIVVKTKQGKYNQKTKVQFNSSVTIGEKPIIFAHPVMSSADVIDVQRALFSNGYYNIYDDIYPAYRSFPALPAVAEILLSARRGEIDTSSATNAIENLKRNDIRKDVDKYLIQNSVSQQYALNISGGGSNFKYFGSVAYDKIRSEIAGNDHRRISIRLDNTFTPTKNLEINSFIVYSRRHTYDNGFPYLGFIQGAQIAPYSLLADESGAALAIPKELRQAYIDTAVSPSLLDWQYRPLDELLNMNNRSKTDDIRLGAAIRYCILPGINTEIKYQSQQSGTVIQNLHSQNTYLTRNMINRFMTTMSGQPNYPVPLGSILDLDNIELDSWNVRGQINVAQNWWKGDFTGLLGIEARQSESDRNNSRKYGFDENINEVTQQLNFATLYDYRPMGTQAIPNRDANLSSINRYLSYFSNIAYSISKKYILSASARLDGSNFFGVASNQRIVPLWSTGLGWQISNEPFYDISWLPTLKFRSSYGFSGNTNNSAAAYPTIEYRNPTSNINNVINAALKNPPNPQLRWEKVKMVNIGIDFAAANATITGTIEYYYKRGLDLISDIKVDATTGVTQYTGNNASIKGRGIDINLNVNNISIGPFRWNSTFLFSYNRDQVTHYDVAPTTINEYLNPYTPIVGHPLFTLFSYRWAGLDPSTGNPRAFHADTIVDFNTVYSQRDPSDLIYDGHLLPTYFGSLRNTLSYKQLSVSWNIIYKLGYVFRRSSINYASLFTSWNGHSDYKLRWQKPGDEASTNVPSMPSISDNRDMIYSYANILVERGDHIRLQDVRIGYNFPAIKPKNTQVKNIQVFLYINNVGLLWKSNKYGIDPEYGDVRRPRSLAAGLSATF